MEPEGWLSDELRLKELRAKLHEALVPTGLSVQQFLAFLKQAGLPGSMPICEWSELPHVVEARKALPPIDWSTVIALLKQWGPTLIALLLPLFGG